MKENRIKRFNENSELNISDVSDSYSIGDKYELFYNSNNPNNRKFEIRGVVDDIMIIFKTEKGNYKMEHIDWFDYNTESGRLKKIK